MQVDTPLKRSYLRRVYRLIPGTYATLTAALNALNDAAVVSSVTAGGTVLEVSANGRTTKLAAPGEFGLSGSDVAELIGDLLDRYDQARADLIAAGTASPSDTAIYTQMLANLVLVLSSTPQFTSTFISGR